MFSRLLPLLVATLASPISASDYGGDFSAGGLSGVAPGATANTMGDKAASAMAIGTGSSGAGDYASNFKTPNFTQYTQQDFKEFMPNYQEMMNTTMGAMSGGGSSGGAASSFANFTSVNVMLKGFMELQKEQLEVEKAKAEASRAKLNLALEEEDDEDEYDQVEAEDATAPLLVPRRHRRSIALNEAWTSKRKGSPGTGSGGLALPLSSLSSTTKGIALLKAASATFRQEGDKLIRLRKPKRRQVGGANWGSSADNWMGGDIKKWGGGGQQAASSGERQSSQRRARQFWPGMPGGASKRDTQGTQGAADGSGGGAAGKNFWANFGSMFSGGGAAGAKTDSQSSGSWSNSSPGSSGGATGNPSWAAGQGSGFPAPSNGGTGAPSAGGQQFPSPPSSTDMAALSNGGQGGPPYMMGQGSPGAGGSSGAFSQQGNQRRSLMSPMSSGSMAPSSSMTYPMHGSVALSNVPGTGSIPNESTYNENIPNLSFSLNPPTPAPKEAAEEEVVAEDELLPSSAASLLMSKPTLGYLMPTSYSRRPSYVEMAAMPPSTSTVLEMRPSSLPITTTTLDGPQYFGQGVPTTTIVDNGPIMVKQTPSLVYVNPNEAVLRPSYEAGPLMYPSRLLATRDAEKEEPLVISMTNGDNEDAAVKKIVLDPDNGIVVTQDKARKKRSAEETASEPTEATTEAAKEDETSTDASESTTMKNDDADPNGHSHGRTNSFKSDSMEAMMKPFMGFSKMFSSRNLEEENRLRRRVKIDFLQNGEELPEGTVETISAGGGKAPGHHEGGGLTVKVKSKEDEVRSILSHPKPRKTLNFFFTW